MKIFYKFLFFFIFSILLINNHVQNYSYAVEATTSTPKKEDNAIVTVLCNVVNLITGDIAKGVAIVAIVVVAIGLFMGKFSWGVALATAIGIAMIFGASTVVEWLSKGIGGGGGTMTSCNKTT
jgi:type IV secretory pathway VirB2 component (pilin)